MFPTSLNALTTFESAARHKSYSLAAAELHVTHSAVSQQMRLLENSLGTRLFERQGRQMLLTPEGANLHKQIQPALRQISRALSNISLAQHAPAIRVSTLQSFATCWLVPRLGKFQQLRPDVTIHIQASLAIKNLDRSETDIAIRFGLGKWDRCDAEKLLDDHLYPVCSPRFNNGRFPSKPSSLKSYRVLCDENRREWDIWSKFAGIDATEFKHETHHSDSNLMLAAARAGQGIAIGRSSLVADDIASGSLVRLFDVVAPSNYSYYMVTASGTSKSAQLLAFEQWLRQEVVLFSEKIKALIFQ